MERVILRNICVFRYPPILPYYLRTCEKHNLFRRVGEKIVSFFSVPLDHTSASIPQSILIIRSIETKTRKIRASQLLSGVRIKALTTLRHLVLNGYRRKKLCLGALCIFLFAGQSLTK